MIKKPKYKSVGQIDTRLYKHLDLAFYRENYPDLISLTDNQLILHYVNHGKEERRLPCIYRHDKTNSVIFNKIEDNSRLNTCYTQRQLINGMGEKPSLHLMNDKPNIIIVDMKWMQGGAYMALQWLIYSYKNSVNFIVIRELDENDIYVSLNDDEILQNSININEIPNYISITKSNIMFINSLATQTPSFIDMLGKIDIYKVGITHDFSVLYSITQPTYLTNLIPVRDEGFYNLIISQHYVNCELMNIQNAIVCELPDYFERKDRVDIIDASDHVINIAVIGNATDIKGGIFFTKLLEMINSHILLKQKYNFRIFGNVNIDNLRSISYGYDDIICLNKYLVDYKPNIIIEASIWPETWSLSLSLSQIIGLPILYINKPFKSVVSERLRRYDKAYSFENVVECFILIDKYKQDYFYTIDENKIKIPYFYDSLFKNKYTENLIIITSKIVVSQKEYTYVNTRSIYSTEERLNQTLDTIQSIHNHFKNKYFKILLVDNSKFDSEQMTILSSKVDFFVTRNQMQNIESVDYETDEEIVKGFGEAAQMNCAIQFVKDNCISFKNLFKISGRYLLNDTFVFESFNNNKINFKLAFEVIEKNPHVTEYYYTSLFKISFNYLSKFHSAIKLLLTDRSILCDKASLGYEQQLLKAINRFVPYTCFKLVMHLGLTQNISVWGKEHYSEQLYI